MVTSNMNSIIKSAVSHKKSTRVSFGVENGKRKSEMCNKKFSDSGKLKNRTVSHNNVLRNINSAIFAMLLQRTTFTLILVFSSVISLSHVASASATSTPTLVTKNTTTFAYEDTATKQKVVPAEVTVKSTPVYIPLSDTSSTEKSFVAGIVNDSNEKQKHLNRTYNTGNALWDGFLNECLAKPSLSCIQKNVYSYLDDSLGFNGDLNITDGFKFKKNKLAYWKYTEKANKKILNSNDESRENEVDSDGTEEARQSESPIEEVTDALYDKGVGFMMSHDLELQLPEIFFNGAVLKVSPRSLEGSGALIHLDFQPKTEISENGEGRIFFKKIKKYIKNKVLLGILAIILIIKLIKIKLFVFLPLLIGVAKAKKFFLQLVLFIFPALANIFKLCSWYHENYHQTKYHHHHHQVSHLHHGYPSSPGYGYGPPSSHTVEVHGGYPPAASSYSHEQPGWEFSGPGLGSEYLIGDIHRNSFSPKLEDASEISSWGLAPPGPAANTATNTAFTKPYSAYYDEQRYVRAAATAEAASRVKAPQGPPYAAIRNQNQINPQIEKEALLRAAQRQEQLRIVQAQQQTQQILRQQAEQKLLLQQQFSQPQNIETNNNLGTPVYDPFYTPILQKIDQVFAGLGFSDEFCRERLVCSMYKNPPRYSPHSNLISNELSRDASDLQKPAPGSVAAIRFYKYVQAARDGQDKKDCLQLYPQCATNTEK